MARIVNAFEQFFDSAGDPLVSGKLFFFDTGSSTVMKDTFSDPGETIANSNPVILNGDGRSPNVFGTGSYRVVLTDANDVQILARDPVGGDIGVTFGADWNALQIYDVNDVVRDDGRYWISITSNNQNNQPSTDGGVNWVPYPQIESDNYVDGSIERAALSDALYVDLKSGRKNLVINGNFDFWQRGTSGFTVSPRYTADRWQVLVSNGTFNVLRLAFTIGQTDVPNEPEFFLRLDNQTGSTPTNALDHRIEDVRTAAAQTVSVSFYARSSLNGKQYGVRFAQNFGAGGSAENQTATQSFTMTNAFQRFEFQFTLPNIIGTTIGLGNYLALEFRDVFSNDIHTLDLAQVQVEIGTEATDFDVRPKGEEFLLCLRYYERLTSATATNSIPGQAIAVASAHYIYNYKVVKRAIPSFSFSQLSDLRVTNNAGSGIIPSAVGTIDISEFTQTVAWTVPGTPLGVGDASRGIIIAAGYIDYNAEI